jgi:hypothetical protein
MKSKQLKGKYFQTFPHELAGLMVRKKRSQGGRSLSGKN